MENEEMGLEAVLRRLIREEIQAALGNLSGRDRLLTAEQAAELLACSPDYLYRRVNKLPFVRRIGRMVRFSERAIHAYLESKNSSNQRILPKFNEPHLTATARTQGKKP